MIVCQKIYGKVKHFKLRYSTSISLQNSSEGSVIYPNVDYWETVYGLKEETQYGRYKGNVAEEYNGFFENHWVETTIFHSTLELCEQLGFDDYHAHNIVIPLSDFYMADVTLIGSDVRDVARDVKKLTDLFIELENIYRKVISVSFEVGHVKSINPENGWYHFTDHHTIKVDVPRAINPFMDSIRRLVKTDVELNAHIHGKSYRHFENQSLNNHHWQMKNLRGVFLFQYLMGNNLAKSKRDGYIKTGKFMSMMENDFIFDEDEFERNSEELAEYKSYDYYLADVMGKRINRCLEYYESMTENS